MVNLLQTQTTNIIEKLKETLRLEELRNTIINVKFSNIDENKIKKCFEKIGVELIENRTTAFFKNVSNFTGNQSTDEDLQNATLQLEYRVRGIKIKPITFNGYTSRGAGKNRDRLVAKAEKLEKKITELTGYKCYINHYGMEVKNSSEDFQFTISFNF